MACTSLVRIAWRCEPPPKQRAFGPVHWASALASAHWAAGVSPRIHEPRRSSATRRRRQRRPRSPRRLQRRRLSLGLPRGRALPPASREGARTGREHPNGARQLGGLDRRAGARLRLSQGHPSGLLHAARRLHHHAAWRLLTTSRAAGEGLHLRPRLRRAEHAGAAVRPICRAIHREVHRRLQCDRVCVRADRHGQDPHSLGWRGRCARRGATLHRGGDGARGVGADARGARGAGAAGSGAGRRRGCRARGRAAADAGGDGARAGEPVHLRGVRGQGVRPDAAGAGGRGGREGTAGAHGGAAALTRDGGALYLPRLPYSLYTPC